MISLEEKEIELKHFQDTLQKVKNEIGKVIVGQEEVTEQVLWAMLSDGHALLEGMPGVGKTMLVRTISEVLNFQFSRIQFTPDLMPSDITGTKMIEIHENGKQSFVFHEGPIFSNIVLADEINRATPKTQSSLLEAMAEKTVTIMGETRKVATPFFVLATQNPVDMEGTYPLPEAQMDRFLLKIHMGYPKKEELYEIIKRTTGTETYQVQSLLDIETMKKIQHAVKEILVSQDLLDYAVHLIQATHPEQEQASEMVRKYIRYGVGPRGIQSLIRVAKARAFCNGRLHVSKGDIKHAAIPVLRHRLFLNFEGEATGVKEDEILEEVIQHIDKGLIGR
ncbi:Holliday junction DNA helicase RuvB [Bacillus sp. THAF10]|uniref:AAA family ATPase n=1 Tax=Bacillus sp. THAF10 TaxID=2587848 RepID=UPI0012687523|nr:MoxR family ATPase [Bacillus sp. THAF10]QFT89287.1 Holliday junction DNA helicase RuvB [Bacillus sp. THAF10]